MKTLETIVLRYKMPDRIVFQSYAEFLRLAGIYVWEYQEEYHNTPKDAETEFGDALVLDVTELVSQMDAGDKEHSWKNLFAYLEGRLLAEQAKPDVKNQFEGLLSALPQIDYIYQEYNLLKAVTTLQYYRMNNRKVQEAAEQFEKAANKLDGLLSDDETFMSNRYVRYATLYCKQRANLGKWICKQPLVELADILADKCLELAEAFPDFSNVWVLRGLSYETSDRYAREAVEAFQVALEKVGNLPFASSICYWIGKRCESYKAIDKMRLTEDAYKYGYELEPKYRLCFKMAYVNERWFRWKDAHRYYMECLDRLAVKGAYLDPLEQEYCYKTAICAAYNCLAHLEDVKKAISLLIIAEDLRKRVIDGRETPNQWTAYYFDFYGEEASEYIALQIGRMSPLQLYQYLAKAYKLENEAKKSKYYDSLFEQERRSKREA